MYRRSINLNLLGDIKLNPKEILLKWIRGLSMIIIILSIILYLLKTLFFSNSDNIQINQDIDTEFTVDKTNNNYKFNFTLIDKNLTNNVNDSAFILNEKIYELYLKNFNITSYETKKNKQSEEMNLLYKLFKFDKIGNKASILVYYSSSLPHYPLFAGDNDNCFIRGNIIAKIDNLNNLSCFDIEGIIYEKTDFVVNLGFLTKRTKIFELFIFKEVNINKELKRYNNKYNMIFYRKNDMKKNLRYCSNELNAITKKYFAMEKNYIPVIIISWKNKTEYFCFRNINLFYE